MANLEDIYQKLAILALSYKPDGLHHVEILHKWFADGDEEGPAVLYLTKDGADLGNRMDDVQYDEFSSLFHKSSSLIFQASRLENTKANLFLELIKLDGSYTVMFKNDAELDSKREAETRASIGDELYEKYERERKEKATSFAKEDASVENALPETEQDDSPLTKQELMRFLYQEVVCDVPEGWQRVEIESQLGKVEGKNEIHVTYRYFLPDDNEPHRFTTTNIFGPMNAISEIEKLMSAEGQSWAGGRFTLTPDGQVSLQTDEAMDK